tara:strand:+ start:382 stop:711 length:330 start_codon:yes stop_codon:yes gene_type:complete
VAQFLNVKGIENGTITSNKLATSFINDLYTCSCFATDLSCITTDNVNEGVNNLYFTNVRANCLITAATGSNLDLSQKTTDDLAQGTCNKYASANTISEDDALALAIALG